MSDFEENIELLQKKLKLAYDYIENGGCDNRPSPGYLEDSHEGRYCSTCGIVWCYCNPKGSYCKKCKMTHCKNKYKRGCCTKNMNCACNCDGNECKRVCCICEEHVFTWQKLKPVHSYDNINIMHFEDGVIKMRNEQSGELLEKKLVHYKCSS